MLPPDRIERAIVAARAVAESDGARELARHSKGTAGVWSAEDEARLRAGKVRVWNPNRRYDETIGVGAGLALGVMGPARESLFRRCDEARARCGHG